MSNLIALAYGVKAGNPAKNPLGGVGGALGGASASINVLGDSYGSGH
jgi:hypothetical protein